MPACNGYLAAMHVDGDAHRTDAELRAQAAADAREIARLKAEVAEGNAELALMRAAACQRQALLRRLQHEAGVHESELSAIEERLVAAQSELTDLRAVRDALTPPELPARPGLSFAVSFAPATQRVSGDFYLAAEGPRDSTVLVVGDVAGKGAEAAQRAAFVRTTFVTTSRFSDDPSRLLEWANVALTERAGYTAKFVTAVCMTYSPTSRLLRWALAGHPPPLRLDTGDELSGTEPGPPLGIREHLRCECASVELGTGDGVLLYTDGLVESRRRGELFGVARAREIIREMAAAPRAELVSRLRDEAASFGGDTLVDDLCLLAVSALRG